MAERKTKWPPFDIDDTTELIDTLALDFGSCESEVHQWKKLPDCDEFVGARRSKHTIVAWKGALYVFGGDNGKRMLNDMLRFDIKECSWSRAITKGRLPAPRYHHSAAIFEASMLIFGGFTADLYSNTNLQNKNDLFEYRFSTGQWIEWNVEGSLPPARSAHGAAIYNDRLWIFAGYDGNKRLNDMWTIKLTDQNPQWQEVQQSGDCPPTCCDFPVAVARDSMFMFSGQSGAKITNDMFQFSFREQRWSLIPAAHLLRGCLSPPQRRYGHSMVAFDCHVYVFGGAAENTLPADLYRFDLDQQSWQVVQPSPDSHIPSGRLFHAGTAIDSALYIFGGTVDNNIRSGELFRFQLASYPRCTLRDDFARLLDSKLFCDVIFVVGQAEKKRFPAHMCFVAARSPWLRRQLLQYKDNEKETNSSDQREPLEVKLEQLNPDVFAIALCYMYSDCIYPLLKDHHGSQIISLMMDVCRLALKLEIGSLEQLCVQYIESSICQENVLVALESASRLQLDSLKEFCLRFIVREANYTTIIMSKEFESMTQGLMVQIIRRRQLNTQTLPDASVCDNQKPLYPVKSLQQAMEKFLTGPHGDSFHDITLLIDGHRVAAHKAILASRSSYFEALFRSFMPEDNSVNITIGETVPSRNAFHSLLRYIYYGDVTMPPEDSLYLLSAPFFFGFTNNRLQIFCKENLEKNVSFQNVVEILEAAHQIGAAEMKKHSLDIIVHCFPNVARSPKLRSLTRELLLEILDAIADHMKTGNKDESLVSQ